MIVESKIECTFLKQLFFPYKIPLSQPPKLWLTSPGDNSFYDYQSPFSITYIKIKFKN